MFKIGKKYQIHTIKAGTIAKYIIPLTKPDRFGFFKAEMLDDNSDKYEKTGLISFWNINHIISFEGWDD